MKRMILGIPVLLMTSCELPFDLREVADKDMIKLCCEVQSGDTTVVDIDVLVPVGDYQRIPSDLEEVVMTVDGNEVGLSVASENERNLEPGTLYVVEEFEYGSEICIKASAGGADPIEAKTTVPLSLEGSRMDMELTDMVGTQIYGEESRNIVRAKLVVPEADEAAKIGIQYIVKCETDSCGVALPEYTFVQAVYDVADFSSDDSLISNADFLHLQQIGNSNRYMWKGTNEYEFIFYHPVDYSDEWVDEQGNTVVWNGKYSFKFRIFAFSDEYYRYHSRATNEFFELGMASPSYTYTNVKGGTGFLGAVNVIDTPWMNERIFEGNDTVSILVGDRASLL